MKTLSFGAPIAVIFDVMQLLDPVLGAVDDGYLVSDFTNLEIRDGVLFGEKTRDIGVGAEKTIFAASNNSISGVTDGVFGFSGGSQATANIRHKAGVKAKIRKSFLFMTSPL